jgi:PAS domain S-box-containing protein
VSEPPLRAFVLAREEEQRRRLVEALAEGDAGIAGEPVARLESSDLHRHCVIVAAWEPDLAQLIAGRPDLTVVAITPSADGHAIADALEADVDDCVGWEALGGGALGRLVRIAHGRRRQRSAAAFGNAMDGMFVLDDERRIITVNPAAEALLGVPADDLFGRVADDFVADRHAGDAALAWRRAIARDRPTRREFCVRRADGQELEVESTVSPGLGPGRHLIALRDVSARRRAEAEADRAREELQAVIDGLPSQVFVKDRQLRYRLINARMERELELEPGWMIGRTDEVIMRREDIARVRANDLRVLETGETVTSEDEMELAGRPVVLLTHKFPIRDQTGAINGVCGVSTDITARQRLLADVRRRRR